MITPRASGTPLDKSDQPSPSLRPLISIAVKITPAIIKARVIIFSEEKVSPKNKKDIREAKITYEEEIGLTILNFPTSKAL